MEINKEIFTHDDAMFYNSGNCSRCEYFVQAVEKKLEQTRLIWWAAHMPLLYHNFVILVHLW